MFHPHIRRCLFFSAIAVILCLPVPAQQVLAPATAELRYEALRDKQDVDRLITLVASTGEQDGVRIAAIRRLAAVDEPALAPVFLHALADVSPAVRASAARALAIIGDDNAAIPVATLLQDTHPEVRLAAVTTLGWLRNAETLPALQQSVYDDDPKVREAAVLVLGCFDDPRAKDALLALAKNEASPASGQALLALAWHGEKQTILPLLLARVIAPGFHDLRAVQALAELGAPEATEALAGLFAHQDREIRQAAGIGLARIATPRSITRLCTLIQEKASGKYDQEEQSVYASALRTLPSTISTDLLTPFLVGKTWNLSEDIARFLAQQYDVPTVKIRKIVDINADPYPSWAIYWLGNRQPAQADEFVRAVHYPPFLAAMAPSRAWRDSEKIDWFFTSAISLARESDHR